MSTFRRAEVLVPADVLFIYSDLDAKLVDDFDWESQSERDLWRELCLCILSGSTRYETALSATQYLEAHKLLEALMIRQDGVMLATLTRALGSKIFKPRRPDGSLRKCRFPALRASQIREAAQLLYSTSNPDGLRGLLASLSSEEEARDRLSAMVPGMAMKEASHFLRNIGYAHNLAIIDVHVRRFLHEVFGLDLSLIRNGASAYRELEDFMRYIADANGLKLALLDAAVWNYMRLRRF